jgi:hypothetical protein
MMFISNWFASINFTTPQNELQIHLLYFINIDSPTQSSNVLCSSSWTWMKMCTMEAPFSFFVLKIIDTLREKFLICFLI